MKFNPLFVTILISLIVAGASGLWLINNDPKTSTEKPKTNFIKAQNDGSQTVNEGDSKSINKTSLDTSLSIDDAPHNNSEKELVNQFKELLKQKHFESGIQLISDHYSSLNQSELDYLKALLLSQIDQLSIAQQPLALSALLSTSELFNEAVVWQRAANIATQLENWEAALQAQLSLFQFQSDPQEIAKSLRAMLVSSNELRAKFESRSDELSIKSMYERILRITSNTPRFQLELAYSHLRLEEKFEARALLEQLVYDPELGEIAQKALDQLNQSAAVVQVKPTIPKRRINGIVVPLEAHGTSFIVNTRIERQNTRLLLDTGASITALSRELIDRLNLQPLNRQIRLNTANGSTLAELYQVERLQLGRLVLSDIVIADIDMGSTSNFQGLLGTDTLNKLRNDYDYVIDNGQKALIFKPK